MPCHVLIYKDNAIPITNELYFFVIKFILAYMYPYKRLNIASVIFPSLL